jgi:hypothetical protein
VPAPALAADLPGRFATQAHFEHIVNGLPDHPTWARRHELLDLLKANGVRTLRLGAWALSSDLVVDPAQSNGGRPRLEYVDQYHQFCAEVGERGFQVVWGLGAPGGDSWFGPPRLIVQRTAERYADFTVAAEGVNEYDNPHVNPRRVEPWPVHLRDHTRLTYRAWRDRPELDHAPYLAPSLTTDLGARLTGDLTDISDAANLHPYAGNQPFATGDGLAYNLERAHITNPGQPWWVTEYGHTTATDPSPWPRLDETWQAILLLSQFLTMVRAGAQLCAQYEAVDNGPEDTVENRWGMVRQDLTPKPALEAFGYLFRLCGDRTPRHPTPLGYTLTTQAADVRHLPLEKHDGSHLIAVWREAPYATPAAPVVLAGLPPKADVHFPVNGQKGSSAARTDGTHILLAGAVPFVVHTRPN